MLEILEYFTVGFGCISGFCSMALFLYFIRSPRQVGKAVAYVFLAESVGLWITVIFSVLAGVYEDVLSQETQMLMRWVMFGTAAASSVHMACAVDQLLRDNHGPRND